MDEPFLTTKDVGKLLDRTSQAVILYERQGRLPAIKTASGLRLFKASDVREFARKYLQSQTGSVGDYTAELKKSPKESE